MADLTPLLDAASVDPDRDGLFRWISREISTPLLAEIASADWGRAIQENLRAFERLIGRGRVEAPIDTDGSWLQEVCGLTMWGALSPYPLTVTHHQQILFATTILVHAGAPGGPWHDEYESLSAPVGALVQSALALGPAARKAATAMLADALIRENRHPRDRVLLGCGVYLLMAKQTPAAIDVILDLENSVYEQKGGDEWMWYLGPDKAMWPIWRRLFSDHDSQLGVELIVDSFFT